MKAVLGVCFALILASCASAPLRYTTSLDDGYKDGVVRISLLGFVPEGSTYPEGLTVQCENAGTSSAVIRWEKSSIILDSDEHPVYLESGAYGNAKGVPPESALKAGSRVSATVYPAERVSSMGGGWGPPKLVIQPLGARDVSLSLCVNVAGEDRFYTLKVVME